MESKYSYRFTKKAEQDLDEILNYISVDLVNPAAAQNLGRKIFEKIDMDVKGTQAIILTPTHELAVQVFHQAELLQENSGMDVGCALLIGAAGIGRQMEKLKSKPRIVVGSVGRILDLIRKKKIQAHLVKTIVLDEGDRLMDDGNVEDVEAVVEGLDSGDVGCCRYDLGAFDHYVASAKSESKAQEHEEGTEDGRCRHFRKHKETCGIHAHHVHGIDLLGDAHAADFGRDVGAHLSCKDEGNHRRTEFKNEAFSHHISDIHLVDYRILRV